MVDNKKLLSKLVLGTVQFGVPYGLLNSGSPVIESEVRSILNRAYDSGVRALDTASTYGDSESVLGRLGVAGRFNIATKLSPFSTLSSTANDIENVEKDFFRSLERLKVDAVNTLFVHHARDLIDVDRRGLSDLLLRLKKEGFVEKVGVSVYTSAEITELLKLSDLIDLIQLPASIIDQRLINGGDCSRLRNAGIEVQVRSIFLQGVLLMEFDSIPDNLSVLKNYVRKFEAKCSSLGISRLQACIGWALNNPLFDSVVLGVDSDEHFREMLESISSIDYDPSCIFEGLPEVPAEILNPTNW